MARDVADAGSSHGPLVRVDSRYARYERAGQRRPSGQLIPARVRVLQLLAIDAAVAAVTAVAAITTHFGGASLVGRDAETAARAFLIPALWLLTMALSGAYANGLIFPTRLEVFRVLRGALILAAFSLCVALYAPRLLNLRFGLTTVPALLTLTLMARGGARAVLNLQLRAGRVIHRVLVVGHPADANRLEACLQRTATPASIVVGTYVIGSETSPSWDAAMEVTQGPVTGLHRAVEQHDADMVVVSSLHEVEHAGLNDLAWQLADTRAHLAVMAVFPEAERSPSPVLQLHASRLAGPSWGLKHLVDRLVAAILLVVLAPAFVAIALAIRLTSTGPAFYRQVRPGHRGARFVMWKFRTMRVDCDDRGATTTPAHADLFPKNAADARITGVGRFLRRYSLDELPQLWNVVNGTMALVGPRPLLVAEVPYTGEEARRRVLVKPGMTGLWQVSGRSDMSAADRLRLDHFYVENWSLRTDLAIVMRTFNAVLSGRGAY